MTTSQSYWQIQDPQKPLFGDLLWSRPENKMQAGKLLIIGGNAHGFNELASTYNYAVKAGAGTIKVVIPDALKKLVGKSIDNTYYCPSTPSGSFAKSSLAELLDLAGWADMVLFAGNLGRNSETAILLESFIKEFKGPICLVNDALDYFIPYPSYLLSRDQTLIVATIAELQKLSVKLNPENVIKFEMSLAQLSEALHQLSLLTPSCLITKQLDNLVVSVKGKICTTKVSSSFDPWREVVAAYSSVWLMQNPAKPYEALVASNADLFVNSN